MRSTFAVFLVFCVLAAALANACGGGGTKPVALIARDPGHLLFRADRDVDDVIELYCVSGSAMTLTKLSDSPPNHGGVRMSGFGFAPDASWVGYLADPYGDTRNELLVVRPDGTGRRSVHAPSATAFFGVEFL